MDQPDSHNLQLEREGCEISSSNLLQTVSTRKDVEFSQTPIGRRMESKRTSSQILTQTSSSSEVQISFKKLPSSTSSKSSTLLSTTPNPEQGPSRNVSPSSMTLSTPRVNDMQVEQSLRALNQRSQRKERLLIESDSGQESGSEYDRDDGNTRKRKRKIDERRLPWYRKEMLARAFCNPLIAKTRETLELFGRDPLKVKQLIGFALSAPSGFPSSEWDNIIRGNAIDLDVVLSSLHHVSAPKEIRGRIGQVEISLGHSEPTRKVETSGQWISAWNTACKAIRFAFEHREEELREYSKYIEGLFSSRVVSSHNNVILFDKAVRAHVGGGQRILLTETNKFAWLFSAILMPEGIYYKRNSSKRPSGSGGAKFASTCNRFNSTRGCTKSKSECRWRHACRKCGSIGHGGHTCAEAI
ncbi:hypothetical protein D9615_002556 [Tricholomella constricta]|uniref:C3H1-type domain-containing protein n=1 Tax=Tricholomella constricta TaxID=117010 RepID=A0A8H5HMD8_9AGAR|nr:hypothetical protein D9615_002556 [Tricholomella constricta]